ncbi:hypothetical protein PoB_003799500 [Plakobranchus ocellatus]|uniref:Uncharacterized protein n=1 Tax=Plakobranchus ocellatus TaxID=259542 RepID=A0AAV4AXF7_9GAST|nr:hypothetical protein PoB_003799500 [Plakobranchus ocellatus]
MNKSLASRALVFTKHEPSPPANQQNKTVALRRSLKNIYIKVSGKIKGNKQISSRAKSDQEWKSLIRVGPGSFPGPDVERKAIDTTDYRVAGAFGSCTSGQSSVPISDPLPCFYPAAWPVDSAEVKVSRKAKTTVQKVVLLLKLDTLPLFPFQDVRTLRKGQTGLHWLEIFQNEASLISTLQPSNLSGSKSWPLDPHLELMSSSSKCPARKT